MSSVKYQCQNHRQKPLQSLGESLDPSVSLMKMSGKSESHQLSAPARWKPAESPDPRTSPVRCSCFLLSTSKKKLPWWTWLVSSKPLNSEKISVLLLAAWVLPCCSRSGYVKSASHTVDWTPFFSTHLHRASAVITTESWGGNNKTAKKQVLENCGVAMFVATPVFRNEGAVYWNGEISDFHNTSCSGTALCSLPAMYHGVSGPPAVPTQLLLGHQIMPQTIHINF